MVAPRNVAAGRPSSHGKKERYSALVTNSPRAINEPTPGNEMSFERKWLRGAKPDLPVLERPDFSTLNDLYQFVGNVYAMRIWPIDVQSLVIVAVVTALPIAVVALSSLPLNVLGQFIVDLMF